MHTQTAILICLPPPPDNQPPSAEKITEEVAAKLRSEMINELVEEKLSQYDEETSKVVKHFYDKLSSGEQITSKNVGSFIEQAERLAMPDKPKLNPLSVGSGGQPIKP